MTKVKKSITISGELDGIIAILATKLDQTTSELIEFRLREDPQIKAMLQELRAASEPPEYEKTKKSMIAR